MKDIEKFALGWMVWFAICATAGFAAMALIGWAIIRLVLHYT